MTSEEIKALQKDVRRKKRIASEHAQVLHDLVEDQLPAGYDKLLDVAKDTFEACVAWDEANQKLQAAEATA